MIGWLEGVLLDPWQLWWVVPCAVGGLCTWAIARDLRRRRERR